jgi:hypothetical protein
MLITVVFFVIAFVCVAMLWNEGMWANTLTFVNVTLAAMLATNCYEPLANYLDQQAKSWTYVWDFLALWGVFSLAFALLRAVSDEISKHQVRFRVPVEVAGRVLFAVATAWVIICFTCMSLHTAPLARTAFRGSFAKEPLSNHFLGLAPDRIWLGFMHSRSKGALATSQPRVFDEEGEFIIKYGARRHELQLYNALEGTIRVKAR